MAQSRMTAVFHGRVQGVGFRYTTVNIAQRFSVTGYVMNLFDGTVEVVAEGIETNLTHFLAAILEARISRYITQHTVEWEVADGHFSSFGISF